jgi:hypothetical protein
MDRKEEEYMLDFSSEHNPHWDDQEPTKAEVLFLIEGVKREIIEKYHLQTDGGTNLVIPLPFSQNLSAEDTMQHEHLAAARLCLEVTIFTGKIILPGRYHHFFDEILSNWLPNSM